MRTKVRFGEQDVSQLSARADAAERHRAEVRVLLGGRFRPEIADFYADAPGRVNDFIAELRRVQAELQHLLRANVKRVDDHGQRRGGDVAEAGKKRRRKRPPTVPKRRVDADDAEEKNRAR